MEHLAAFAPGPRLNSLENDKLLFY